MEPAGPARAERRLAAILAADVAGYSRLIEADEEGTLNRLKALRAEVIDPRIAAHRGRIVKTTGDGLLIEFTSVVDALRCAAEMQTALAEDNAALPSERRIEFRVGIHQGDIVVDEGDIFGVGSMSPRGSKAWPSRVASASRSACRRMRQAASTSPSKTWESRR
jgi:adenylate cyclase